MTTVPAHVGLSSVAPHSVVQIYPDSNAENDRSKIILGKIVEMKSQGRVTKSQSLIVGFLPSLNLNNSNNVKRDLAVYTS